MKQEWDVADIAPSEIDRTTRLDATSYVESRGNPRAVSKAGAQGEYQFMPATARQYGVADPFDSTQARAGADRYLTKLEERYGGSAELAHLAYNWGEGNVDAWLKTGKGAKGQPMPEEAQQYVGKIMTAASGKQTQSNKAQEWSDADIAPQSALPKATKSNATLGAEMALEGESGLSKAVIGAGKAASDTVNFGKKLLGMKVEGNKEADKVLLADPYAATGNLAGEIALTAVPGTLAYKGVTAIPRIAQLTGPAGRVLRAAAGGSAAGAVGEAMLNRDPVEGAAIGAVAGPVLEKAVSLAGSGSRALLNTFGGTEGRVSQQLRGAFDNPDAAVAHLRSQRADIPGERLTVGGAATPTFPEFKAFETRARNRPGAAGLLEVDAANQAAREGVIDRIARQGRAGTAAMDQPAPLSPAAGRRQAATNPLYEAANPERVTVNPVLQSLMDGQEVQAAVREGQVAFNQKQMLDAANGRPTSPSRIDADHDLGTPAVYSIDELQHIKGKLTEQIDRVRMSDPEKAHRLNETRRALTQEMEAQSQNYSRATQEYRRLSQPQNSGLVAQELLDALRAPAGKERASAFLGSMRNAPSTLQNALGKSRFSQISQVMTPDQMRQLRNVQRSVNRQASVANLNVPEGVVNKYRSMFDKIEEMSPPLFSQVVTTLRRGLRILGRRSDEDVDRMINEAVVDPARFANLMEQLPPGERNAVINSLTRLFSQNRELAGGAIGTMTGQIGQE